MASVLAIFTSQAKRVMFYGTATYPGEAFQCYLEPSCSCSLRRTRQLGREGGA